MAGTEEAQQGLLKDKKEDPELGMKMDTSKAKEAAASIKDDTADFAKKLKQDIGTTWEEMRSAKFTMALDSEDDTWWKKGMKCFMTYLMKPLIIILMIYVFIAQQLYKVYKILPIHLLEMIFGVGLCFFGGVYFASIAAFEAFRNFGGQLLIDELSLCWEQALLVKAANEEDDKKDLNKDGIADVQQMSYNELINHKAKMAMMAVEKPDRLMKATQYLFTAWVSVIATLKSQFAKTVAIALGIADQLELPMVQVFGPMLAMLLGKDGSQIRAGAVISAFYSGLRGGRLFGEAFMYGVMPYVSPWLPECCNIPKDFNPEDSYIDEIVGFPLAAAGFYYQLTNGFALEFPYSMIMFPCTMVEWVIRRTISAVAHPDILFASYQLCRMMSASKDVAAAIAGELNNGSPPDAVAAAAYEAIWSQQNQGQRDFAVFGGEFLMELDVSGLRGWFQGFFNLPEELWAGFLAGWPSLPGNVNHESWLPRLSFGLQLVTKIPLPVALKLVGGIARFSLTYGTTLLRSVTPLFGSPPSYAWTPPVPKEEVGDVPAKLEALRMMKESQPTEAKAKEPEPLRQEKEEKDWTVSTQRMQVEISHLQVLQEDEIHQLVQYLDHEGSGRVSYQSFRTMVVRFLATSRDFHYALSPEEFNAIMFRIESRLASNGTSIGQALAELDSSNSGALSDTEFMQSLRLLRLGLSNKEVAQVFNSLSASSFKAAGTSELPNPLMRGQVSIDLFASLVAKSSKDSRLKEWATSTFNKIREVPPPSLQHSATSCSSSWLRFLRHYADPPVRQFLASRVGCNVAKCRFVALPTRADQAICS
eukprot:s740_g20.t1